jgi:hypothetical protein
MQFIVRTVLFVLAGVFFAGTGSLSAQDKSFTVTLVSPVHGKGQLTPALPADGKYPGGTVVAVTTTPRPGLCPGFGLVLRSGTFGQMYSHIPAMKAFFASAL